MAGIALDNADALAQRLEIKSTMSDLQCRVLHGIVAINAFISVLNPNVQENVLFVVQEKSYFIVLYTVRD